MVLFPLLVVGLKTVAWLNSSKSDLRESLPSTFWESCSSQLRAPHMRKATLLSWQSYVASGMVAAAWSQRGEETHRWKLPIQMLFLTSCLPITFSHFECFCSELSFWWVPNGNFLSSFLSHLLSVVFPWEGRAFSFIHLFVCVFVCFLISVHPCGLWSSYFIPCVKIYYCHDLFCWSKLS